MVKRIGAGTLVFENMPRIRGFASAAGKMESEGPLGSLFDKIIYDSRGGAETYEEAESRLQQEFGIRHPVVLTSFEGEHNEVDVNEAR